MKETAPQSQPGLQGLFSCFRLLRAPAPGTGENTAVVPISTNAIASAESALTWISKVPGGDRAQARIRVALEMIKGLNTACTYNVTPHYAKVLRWLEYHVRYLAELLEPFAMMRGDQISPLLQSEVLRLSRELERISSKIKPGAASKEAPRWYSLHTKGREEHGGDTPDIRAFTLDFKFSLDEFRENALPLYPISPIEAGLLPLGMISNSSCALLPFIEWILKSETMMEYRIGAVRTVQAYARVGSWDYAQLRPGWGSIFMLVGLENRRRIENWLKIVVDGPEMQGSVTFGTIKDVLDEGLPGLRHQGDVHIAEDRLSVTHFARQIKDTCARLGDDSVILNRFVKDLERMYGSAPKPRKH